MPIKSNALPLSLSRAISEQPPTNALYLKLDRELGELSKPSVIYVTANALPLPLNRPLSEQPPSSDLPLSLSRPLGTLGSGIVRPDDPIEPPAPPRRMTGFIGWLDTTNSPAINISDHWQVINNSQLIAERYQATNDELVNIAGCHFARTKSFVALSQCQSISNDDVVLLRHCHNSTVSAFLSLSQCFDVTSSDLINYRLCASVLDNAVINYRDCTTPITQSVINFSSSISYQKTAYNVSAQHTTTVQAAVPVPCRYYPIPEPPPPKPTSRCRIRPPASALPLALTRKRRNLPSSSLPLPLMCWHDELPGIIPSLRTYIMHNVITATVGGIAVDPLSFGIKTDMNSAYWQGELGISDKDYRRIKHKLELGKGNEPLINVVINGFTFTILLEDLTRSRQFANNSYSLSGRSITAQLGADYAKTQNGLLDQPNYASQIVNQQLANLPFTIDWRVADWLIHGGQYSVTDKTPIAVIADIAKACGGFVTSDPSQAILTIKPRWRVAAWELATATPDVILPADIIQKIDDKPRLNPRYNIVALSSNVDGGNVYRQQQGRDRAAPAYANDLYTDRDVIVPAGKAILSDSGNHLDYTLKLRWADRYSIGLALLGDIWQVGDPEGAWRGIVTGVSIDIGRNDNAPTVHQIINIDRYMDI